MGSLGISILLLYLGFPFFFMFLFIPLIPLFGREKREEKICPLCGYRTSGDEIFCPYDAEPLKES
ncbi:hypothetical protein [Methanoplanus endosymbiosus]|uniref:Uncharacterized protein n=1 Tax=Methanoplanus endosymbiosus TaxID=33865 RepID=A0A9E7PKV7_9EURY|nr:hypothetical protein [Methanoplanus endosymbiosus]UUX92033.1 hypothetical protein L6E24_11815 [Methanoplanus endosymbiosus]